MDGIFGIGPLELILIAVIALIVLGPERLPSVMREGARYIREIRKLGNELTSQFSEELKVLDEINPRRIINEALDPNQPETRKPGSSAAAAPPAQQTTAPKAPPVAGTNPAPAPVSAGAVHAPAAPDEPVKTAESPAGGNGTERSDARDGAETAHTILPPPIVSTAAPAQPAAASAPDTHAAPAPESPA